ncbi:hypothetical protein Ancab_021646 [Ancistrocladus abbreviatus]
MDDSTSKKIRFDVTRILISTPSTATISSTLSVAVDDTLFPICVNEEPLSDGCISFTSDKIIHHSSRPSISPSGVSGSSSRSQKLPPLSLASKEMHWTSAGDEGAGLLSPRVCCLQHQSDSHDEPSVSSHVAPVILASDDFLEPSVSHIQETPLYYHLGQHLSLGHSRIGPQNSPPFPDSHPTFPPPGPRSNPSSKPSGPSKSGPIPSGPIPPPTSCSPLPLIKPPGSSPLHSKSKKQSKSKKLSLQQLLHGKKKKPSKGKKPKSREISSPDIPSEIKVTGSSVVDSQFQNMNRKLCNSDGVQSVKEAWDFLSQLGLSSKGKDDEMIRHLEDMEAYASGKVPP